MTIDGLLVNIVGAAIVGLEDDIGLGAAQGFTQRGILAFFEVFWDVFFGGNHAGKRETGFGKGGDVVGEKFGVFTVADDDGFEGAAARFED